MNCRLHATVGEKKDVRWKRRKDKKSSDMGKGTGGKLRLEKQKRRNPGWVGESRSL